MILGFCSPNRRHYNNEVHLHYTNHHYSIQSDKVGTLDSCRCINYNHQIQQKVSNIEVKLPFVHLLYIFLLLFHFLPAILREEVPQLYA